MSIQAVAWALEQDLPARPKLVLVSLCNHANNVDGYCWLKAETIASEAACTPRSVYNFVGALVRNGFIRKALRKGDDGKQRATDYWILFGREQKDWDQDATLESIEGDGEAAETDTDEALGTTSSEPPESLATGESDEPDERHDTRPPVDLPPGSYGPSESGFHRKRIAEPSKTNPKASSAGARDGALAPSTPRGYHPPPVEPQAADPSHPTKQVFVYAGTPAYEAWARHMAAKNRTRSWSLTTRANIDGDWKHGWYFPTLFPPSSTDPPKQESSAA